MCCELTFDSWRHTTRRAHISGQASFQVHICATEYWQFTTSFINDWWRGPLLGQPLSLHKPEQLDIKTFLLVDANHTALFYWSTSTKKSATVDIDVTFHDQLYHWRSMLSTVDVNQLKSSGCTFLLVDVDGWRQAALFITLQILLECRKVVI